MQREIKFRAFDEILGMRPVIELDGEGQWWKVRHINGNFTLSNGALMQFTGLRDKNGVEIYEGDVLGKCVINGSVVNAQVKFSHGSFYVEALQGERIGDDLRDHNHNAVIGNIYENPELLG